jgi:putative ABC transport system permease protein
LLIVSVVLVLIAFVLLRFTINFTIDEEFHEIGVMKAIGIPVRKIRTLYLIKYLAIAIAGSLTGLVLSVPFGNMMLDRVLQNMVADQGYFWVNILCALLTVGLVVLFCFSCTRKIKKLTPIDAVRSGNTGERFTAKGIIKLNKSFLKPVPFMAVNDILGNIKRFGVMIIAFTLGLLLITIPINAANTLNSDYMVEWVSMPPGQATLFGGGGGATLFDGSGGNSAAVVKDARAAAEAEIKRIKSVLAEQGMPAEVSQEMMLNFRVRFDDTVLAIPAYQGIGDSKTDKYTYLEGYPPEQAGEIAITQVSADSLGVKIGDTLMIATGGDEIEKPFIIAGTFQTLFQMGVGIRFNEDEVLDYGAMFFGHAVNVRFTDNPDSDTVKERMEQMELIFPEYSVSTPAAYVQTHTGGMNESLGGIIAVIEAVVIFINMLIAVLMIRSFITKEKGEIAVMKAIGFKTRSLIAWQALRIGIVFAVSGILAALLSEPLSMLGVGPVFKMMGAGSIHFYINPTEIYVQWPVIILSVTMLASILAAFGIYRIHPRQTGNIE